VQVAVPSFLDAQRPGDAYQAFHRSVRAADDARRQEYSLYIVALIEIHDEPNQFSGLEPGSRYVVGAAVDAVCAVVGAGVRKEYLE
jgi:hypothetical protein